MQNSVFNSQKGAAFLYIGPSMLPTFNPGDRLQLEDRDLTTLHPGDIVIFENTKNAEPITVVHRIVMLRNDNFYTRGDNNLHRDSESLTEETYIGKIVAFRRNGRARHVVNGSFGWLYAEYLFLLKWLTHQFKNLFRPLYATVRSHHLAHPIWFPIFTTLTLHTEEHGVLVKTLYRGRTVARYWPATGVYHCRKPFDLVLEHPPHLSRIFEDEAPLDQPS